MPTRSKHPPYPLSTSCHADNEAFGHINFSLRLSALDKFQTGTIDNVRRRIEKPG